MLGIPPIDVRDLRPKLIQWDDWLPPLLFMEAATKNGKTVRLCDFGSAGEVGTPYRSWLPAERRPEAVRFSKTNPLRTK
jgi:hypothetical protein